METWRKEYRVYSNQDISINGPALLIDLFNILWTFTGSLLNNIYGSKTTSNGAIRDCTRDYGIVTTLVVYVLLTFGYVQIIRLAFY